MAFDLAVAAYDVMSDPQMRIEREGDFLKQLLVPDARVLDLACGTGVHAEYLARWSAHVTASDLSPAMIEVARMRRPHERVTYRVGDMREPPAGPFDLIYCIGNSLNLLPSRDAVCETLAAAAERLAEGGALLLHAINPESPAHAEPSLMKKHGTAADGEYVVVKSMVPLAEPGRLLTVTYMKNPSQDTAEVQSEAFVLLDLRYAEMDTMLKQAGLTVQAWYGDLAGSAFAPTGSPDMVVLAKKEA